MDGSQKLPQRLLATMQDRLRHGLPIDTHALAVAGWMRYVTARDEQGRAIDVRDPLAGELCRDCRTRRAGRGATCACAVGSALDFRRAGNDPRMRSAVTEALAKLYALGARQTVQTFQAR